MQTILITGANRGLGLEFARQYAGDGENVIACCRNPAKADALAKLAAEHKNIRIETLDVADDASIAALADKLKGAAIDLLINNAGIYSGTGKRGRDFPDDNDDTSQNFGTIDTAAWMTVLRINTVAPAMVMQAFVPQLKKGAGKKIVNITSGMGSIANMGSGSVAYRSSKAALNAAMRTIMHDLSADKIAIANLHPGWVQTDMGGARANLTPEQSVTAMRKTIARISIKNTGSFFNYDGQIIPW
ncbi:MAG: SDR family oxidoreductase [Alphaproteobacteria bacterium]|nr:SDR family oxidoreductase [Alphaproteobacteria bacterium]